MNAFQRFCLSTVFCLFCLSACLAVAQESSPFGVCAHLQGGAEYDAMPENLQRMRDAGIQWVRADFSWDSAERRRGQWSFDHWDKLLDEAEKHGLKVLPILTFRPAWADPAYENLEEWCAYVEKTVTRYKDRIRCWEIWNEPDLHGFGHEEKGKHYASLLAASYKTIKEIDPGLTVLFGGTSGIPLEFIEEVFASGGAAAFDVMNIHPYRRGMTSPGEVRKYDDELEKLRTLMAKYGAGEKPIWITEMGWPTAPEPFHLSRGILDAARKILAPDAKPWKIAVLLDDRYPTAQAASPEAMKTLFPPGYEPVFISLEDLKGISAAEYQALFFPASERYPTPYMDDLADYVTHGGNLFLLGGVPMYYTLNFDDESCPRSLVLKPYPGSHEHPRQLRIDWRASWHDPDKQAPEQADVAVAEGAEKYMAGYALPKHVTRFLGDGFLEEGDRLIPLLVAVKGDYRQPCVGIYQFDSDMKGAVIVSTLPCEFDANTEADQAAYLPQGILLSLRFGIDRFFWYEFQISADGSPWSNRERECHFGIVREDLSPKPAYHSYAALAAMFPEGSKIDRALPWSHGELCMVSWIRPDSTKCWAVWAPAGSRDVQIALKGKKITAFDAFGKPLEAKPGVGRRTFGRGVTYFIGPEHVSFP